MGKKYLNFLMIFCLALLFVFASGCSIEENSEKNLSKTNLIINNHSVTNTKATNYRYLSYQCDNGFKGRAGTSDSCRSVSQLLADAKLICQKDCTSKRCVASFKATEPC